MEYEKSVRMLCLTKKYAYLTIGVDGNFVVDSKRSTDGETRYKIGNKGVILSCRDNCQFVKIVYEGVDMVLTRPIGEALCMSSSFSSWDTCLTLCFLSPNDLELPTRETQP